MKDRERTRKLALAQEQVIHAKKRLDEVDLRKCPVGLRDLIRQARDDLATASTTVDLALKEDAEVGKVQA